MTPPAPFLTVVIPAYNEAVNFRAGLLTPALDYLKRQKYSWELIFVNDGSTDDTGSLLSGLVKTNPRYQLLDIVHGGKAAAVTAGVLAAKGDFVLFTDFDQSTPLDHSAKFISSHRRGADVVIGVRKTGNTQKDTFTRRIRSWVFLKFVQLIALPGIRDSQCGFKSFSRKCARQIFSHLLVCQPGIVTGGYMGAFDVEVLFLARKYRFTIDQQQVYWTKVPSEKLNVWREPLKMAMDTIKVRLYDIFGKYAKI